MRDRTHYYRWSSVERRKNSAQCNGKGVPTNISPFSKAVKILEQHFLKYPPFTEYSTYPIYPHILKISLNDMLNTKKLCYMKLFNFFVIVYDILDQKIDVRPVLFN